MTLVTDSFKDEVRACPSIFVGLILLMVPSALFVFVLHRVLMTGPIYMGLAYFDYDPAYVYLFSGLSFANLAAPQHVDHPGTPTQLLIAACLRLYQLSLWLVGSERISLYEIVADDPEGTLFFVGLCTTGLYVVGLGFLGHFTWKWTGSISAALLMQISAFLYYEQLIRLAVPNGETSGMLVALAITALFLRELSLGRRSSLAEDWKGPVLIGFCMAGIVFAKVTFAPVVLLLLAIVPYRRTLLTVVAFLVSSLFFALPIVSRLPDLLVLLSRIAAHQGQYGKGESGLIDLAQVPQRFGMLLEAYPGGFVMIGLTLIVLLVLITRLDTSFLERLQDQRIRFLLCLLAAMVLQLGLVLKHFAPHYFVPNLALSMMFVCFITFEVALLATRGRADRLMLGGVVVGSLALVAHLTRTHIAYERALADQKVLRDSVLENIAAFRRVYINAIWIGAYPTPSLDFAVAFGIGYTQPRVAINFQQAWGQPIISFNRWNNRFHHVADWKEASYIAELVKSSREIILHLPQDYDTKLVGLTLTPLAEFGDGSTAYRVSSVP